MPAPLTWDTPGLTYDSGVTWDGVLANPTRPKSMNTKAIIDFSGYPAAELGPVTHNIHDKITANVATFATPAITMAALHPATREGLLETARRLDPLVLRWAAR